MPPAVNGHFEHASSGQVASQSTAVLHLYLESLGVGHAPVAAIQSFLKAYFPEDGYKFAKLSFDLANLDSQVAYTTAASELSSVLSSFSRVLLILTTHTDEDRGDFFAGKYEGVLVASEVSEVSHRFHMLNFKLMK